MDSLNVSIRPDGDTQHIDVLGEVDVSCASELRDVIDEAFEAKPAHIELHMDEVSYIDSTGIGVLVAAAHRAREAQATLSLIKPQRNVARVLSLLGVDEELNLQNRESEE
ncbi:MAG: STAS domain-containing protein [Atopobiaceae bacterium]|nr:STAS domain-containing protein [Atopobiaceae bacterium]